MRAVQDENRERRAAAPARPPSVAAGVLGTIKVAPGDRDLEAAAGFHPSAYSSARIAASPAR